MKWFLWALLLIVQNTSFTIVSRARNSGSYWYLAVASIFSNGIWIVSQFILIESIVSILKKSDLLAAIWLSAFYMACTAAGSVFGQWVSIKWLEKGKRRVGA